MRYAFSLIELSIVLVILGLLTGGILAGQSLIRASELRNVGIEANRFITATHAFRDKYFALPGDMNNAIQFWGVAAGNGTGNDATCRSAVSTDAKTCNGNGDGQILSSTGSNEPFRYWQHLANAGLIEGQYTGQASSSAFLPNKDVPGSKIDSTSAWTMTYNGIKTGSANLFDGDYGNSFSLYQGNATRYGNLTPSEAWNLDTKSDDGKPGTGKVIANLGSAYSSAGTSCTDAANSTVTSASYNLQSATKDCGFFWVRVF